MVVLVVYIAAGVAVADGGRSFTFHKVRPGRYLISAVKEGWCWEGSRLAVAVESSDAAAPDLRHKGYELQVSTPLPPPLPLGM